jgi:hypothetical protein
MKAQKYYAFNILTQLSSIVNSEKVIYQMHITHFSMVPIAEKQSSNFNLGKVLFWVKQGDP